MNDFYFLSDVSLNFLLSTTDNTATAFSATLQCQLYLAAVTHRVSTALVCFVLAETFLLGGRCSVAGDQGLLARFASTLRGLHPRVLFSPMGLVPVLDGQ